MTTYIFGSRPEWSRFTRLRYPARSDIYAGIGTGGFTEGTTSVSFHRSRSTTLATLAHERNHALYRVLGDVYVRSGQLRRALRAYQHALNNLK